MASLQPDDLETREQIRDAVIAQDERLLQLEQQMSTAAEMGQRATPTGELHEFVGLLRQHDAVVVDAVRDKAHNDLLTEMDAACRWAGSTNASVIVSEAVNRYRAAGSPALEGSEEPGEDADDQEGAPGFQVAANRS